jgi:hypothetical protein
LEYPLGRMVAGNRSRGLFLSRSWEYCLARLASSQTNELGEVLDQHSLCR